MTPVAAEAVEVQHSCRWADLQCACAKIARLSMLAVAAAVFVPDSVVPAVASSELPRFVAGASAAVFAAPLFLVVVAAADAPAAVAFAAAVAAAAPLEHEHLAVAVAAVAEKFEHPAASAQNSPASSAAAA